MKFVRIPFFSRGSTATVMGFAGLALLWATPAAGQLSSGAVQSPFASIGAIAVHGNDSAHDPTRDVFLAVGAWGPVRGVFVNRAGQPISSVFTISAGVGTAARVRYHQDLNGGAGGFLVTWVHEANPWTVRTRVVAYPGTLVGAEQVISEGTGADGTRAPALAYSATSKQFLIAWSTPLLRPYARLVNLSGQPVGGIVDLSVGGPGGFAKDVSVTWNPNRNEFGVSYSGEVEPNPSRPAGYNYSTLLIVPATNPAGFRRTTFNAVDALNTRTITDIDFSTSTGRYVMAWFEYVMARTAAFDQNGTQLSGDVASLRVGVHDSLSLAYNPISHTFLLGGLDPQNDNLTGVELNNYGARIGSEALLGPAPAFLSRVSSSRSTPNWLATYAKSYNLAAVPVQTGSTNGGGSGTTTAPPPPTSGGTTTTTTSCPGYIADRTCINGEWVYTGGTTTTPPPPTSGGTTTTTSCPGFIADRTCINGEWVLTGTSGGGGTTTPPPPPPPPTSTSTSCPGFIADRTCINGEWVLTGTVVTSPPPPTTTTSSSCPGFIADQTCVNGEWVLLPVCTGGNLAAPGPSWVRVGLYDWYPPDHPYAVNATCRAQ